MRMLHVVPILVGLMLGCAPAQPRLTNPRPSPSPFLLTAAEIETREWASAYAAVEQLRPWLLHRLRGTVPLVFVDGTPGYLEDLRLIPAEFIYEIRYVHGAEAVRFPGGAAALEVVTTPARGRNSR